MQVCKMQDVTGINFFVSLTFPELTFWIMLAVYYQNGDIEIMAYTFQFQYTSAVI